MPFAPSMTAFTCLLLSLSVTCCAFGPSHSLYKPKSSNSRLFWRRRKNDENEEKKTRRNPRNDSVDRNYEWWKSRERFSPENLQGKSNINPQEQWRQSEEWMSSSPSQQQQQAWSQNGQRQKEPFIFDAEFQDVPVIPDKETTIEDVPYFEENEFEPNSNFGGFEQRNENERPFEQQVDSPPPFSWNENEVVERYNQAPIQPFQQQQPSYLTRTRVRGPNDYQENALQTAQSSPRVDLPLRGKREREARQYNRNLRATQQQVQQESKISIQQKIASMQSGLVGATVGTISMAPFAALFHFVLFPSYSSTAQWEWDTGTALVQGGFFALIYRYLIGRDHVQAMQTMLVTTVCVIRTVVRVQVPMYCTALPLECGESSTFMDWNVLGQLSIHFVESFYLFGTVAMTMDWLLQKEWILPYQSTASNE